MNYAGKFHIIQLKLVSIFGKIGIRPQLGTKNSSERFYVFRAFSYPRNYLIIDRRDETEMSTGTEANADPEERIGAGVIQDSGEYMVGITDIIAKYAYITDNHGFDELLGIDNN